MSQTGIAANDIVDMVRGVVQVCSVPAGEHTVDEWMAIIEGAGAAMTVLAAAADAAIVRLAAIDEVVTEDGVVGEQVNGLGTRCRDAGAMVSTAAGVSAQFGEELVDQALTRVVRVPALHQAMLEGSLDAYKARCVADELDGVPAELARTVVEALGEDLASRTGPTLRRRTRELLFSLSPDLLRERIRTARSGVGLRRWVGQPGTDAWGGTFPSERSASAWAAINALAQRYRHEDRYPTLEMARAHALLDLVHGSASVETVMHLTVPADALAEAQTPTHADGQTATVPAEAASSSSAQRLIAVAGGHGSELSWMALDPNLRHCLARDGAGVALSREGARRPTPALDQDRPRVALAGTVQFAHPATGALIDASGHLANSAYRPGAALVALIRARDARCRFPGCSVAARQCDIDHVIAWPTGATAETNLIALCRRHHRVKQRHRWRVALLPDRRVRWTDPSGRVLDTQPVDHLGVGTVRVIDLSAPRPPSEQAPESSDHDREAQDLTMCIAETRLEIIVEHLVAAGPETGRRRRQPRDTRCRRVDAIHPRFDAVHARGPCTYEPPVRGAGDRESSVAGTGGARAHQAGSSRPRQSRRSYGTGEADWADPPPY